MFTEFNFQQMISAFIVLFAVIDIIGSIPIIINLKEKGKDVNAMKATVISFALLIGFFYAGDMMLKLFHVDIESFAVAGAFVIFLMSLTTREVNILLTNFLPYPWVFMGWTDAEAVTGLGAGGEGDHRG